MVVDRSRRRCVLCGRMFLGRAFLCRPCAGAYRGQPVPASVRQHFYEQIDHMYPSWSNTYGAYNPPRGLLRAIEGLPRDARILELGAGGGYVLDDLRRSGFTNLTGLDLTNTTLVAMRGRLADVALVAADAERLPFADRAFDALISADLVEHLPGLEAHLAEAARVLRPGGQYFIKTPNRILATAYYRLRGLYDAYFWHPSMCSPDELRAALDRHGFDCRFLPVEQLTEAQTRKIPLRRLRPLASRVPIERLPVVMQPHMEVVASRRG